MLVATALHPAINKFDMSSIRMIFCGAAPLSIGLIDKVKRKLAERGNSTVSLIQGYVAYHYIGDRLLTISHRYGLTETSPGGLLMLLEESAHAATCGRPSPGAELRLVDDDEVDAIPEANGEVKGELWIRGPMIMR